MDSLALSLWQYIDVDTEEEEAIQKMLQST